MAENIFSTSQNHTAKADVSISVSLIAVVFFFIASGLVSYWNLRTLNENSGLVSQTHEIMAALDGLLSISKDAETGQRGFVITGDEKYLEPYKNALIHFDEQVNTLEHLTAGNSFMTSRIPSVIEHIRQKLAELDETIQLRRTKGFEASRAVIVTDRGKMEMDMVRAQIAAMQKLQKDERDRRIGEMQDAYRIAVISGVMTGLLGVFLSGAVTYLVRNSMATRRRQDWLQTGQVGLGVAMMGEQRVEKLGENILTFLADYFGAHAGAIFVKEGEIFRRVATYGVMSLGGAPSEFKAGEGLLGQTVKNAKSSIVQDVPEGYLTLTSALGKGMPRHLMIAPVATDGLVNAALELGFLQPVDVLATDLLRQVSDAIAIAVRSANYRTNLQNFLEETQRQAEELQAQSEELRVSNEELEEQSRALKESQVRLEQQQAELEQTNGQLEEQAEILEGQRDDLARAKAAVQLKAQELEQASQYKSDFLANMSHELRTPLNSSLILAKLLADNSAGNLSEEQVRFAQTIQSSGNDLLSLINDILDLSKIEAGHMEIRVESLPLERMTRDLSRVFEPMAQHKGLAFSVRIDSGCPPAIETDRQRLEQIIKNLLSNAFKFTEKGTIELRIGRTPDHGIAFSVRDTGIGIADDKQQAIFEAFRQADGTISRKYGGTGLGLSISRELTRLLGGTLSLKSETGQGSIFTVTLPEIYDAAQVAPHSSIIPTAQPRLEPVKAAPSPEPTRAPIRKGTVKDDRERLTSSRRVILVIEDDVSFASILYDLTREMDFQCLVATTAEEGLAVAMQYLPSAVVLDVGLPDNSGLSVLDRLKHDARTRHIPVHVVSAGDHAQTALSLGAIGYMLKPVKRDDLVETFRRLETKLAQRMRRVLVVEDDAVQRDSVQRLLGSHDVETVGVGTAAECLDCLKNATFDCMVLDLSLPDTSGYALLETLSREDAYSFPPVIVYTGRDLSFDDEQKLRKYSKSIIIKGAKSPERLLDEVTLFLHQVVAELPPEQQKMLEKARNRDAVLEGRHILVVEDDVRNVYALTSIFEPHGALVQIARNGREALEMLDASTKTGGKPVDLVLMDVMMPEMDGLTATREIRKRPAWKKLPVIMLTAKAMKDDQERCLEAGANDYMAKPLDVEKLLSLVRVWMPR